MAREVRVGDSVNVQLADGDVATAQVIAMTTQDSVTVRLYHHDEAGLKQDLVVTRATSFPASVNQFWKMA